MDNRSSVLHLATFEAPYPVLVLIFSLCLAMYLTMTAANLLVLLMVAVSTDLHKPMHIFLCNLAIGDIIISTGGLPKQLQVLLTGNREILYVSCVAQMFTIHISALNEIFTLAMMSVDRYLAICYPLQYHTKVTAKRSILLSLLSWLIGIVSVSIQIILLLSLQLSEKNRQIQGIVCDNMGIFKLAVGDTSQMDAYLTSKVVVFVVSPFCVIVYTYVRILVECKNSSSSEFRGKALHTFGTHFMALAVFFTALFLDILLLRFVKDVDSEGARNLRSAAQLVFLLSPLANVLIYCLRTTELRLTISKHFKKISRKVHFCPKIKVHGLGCGLNYA
ncbi:olfactory receptor 10G9-like [Petromyzon marinus]|uniref:Olfactory receptor 10G9-like n=1 Tax=Petromyzon marinus TaxID=7757 RepID=A0AAJ7UAD9_PETMA|nr:olfactory receptor 10G9-like [Petromyzon marinus]AZL87813.1 odorant receptor [Petromyzon marinus]